MVINEHEEENETDESADEREQPEEEPLRSADAVGLRVVEDLAGGDAHVVVLLAPVPEKTIKDDNS